MPDCAEAHNNLAVVLQSAGQLEAASESYRRVIELRPDCTEARCNLGALLREDAELEEAVAQFREAIGLQPELVEAHVGLGDSLSDLNDADASMKAYDKAIEFAPDHAEARFSRSLALLKSADFERGWSEFEWRWKMAQLNDRELPVPQWDGKPLDGRTILVHAEQGIGDTFQFIRYLPFVKQKGGRVVFACSKRLHTVLQNAPGIDDVASFDASLPGCDCHAPLMALPRLFRTTLEAIPCEVLTYEQMTPAANTGANSLGKYRRQGSESVGRETPTIDETTCDPSQLNRFLTLRQFPMSRSSRCSGSTARRIKRRAGKTSCSFPNWIRRRGPSSILPRSSAISTW